MPSCPETCGWEPWPRAACNGGPAGLRSMSGPCPRASFEQPHVFWMHSRLFAWVHARMRARPLACGASRGHARPQACLLNSFMLCLRLQRGGGLSRRAGRFGRSEALTPLSAARPTTLRERTLQLVCPCWDLVSRESQCPVYHLPKAAVGQGCAVPVCWFSFVLADWPPAIIGRVPSAVIPSESGGHLIVLSAGCSAPDTTARPFAATVTHPTRWVPWAVLFSARLVALACMLWVACHMRRAHRGGGRRWLDGRARPTMRHSGVVARVETRAHLGA
mmetsp:Transcript_96570/g.300760  ORF Transcript_96570/g.300760 Transcript_96570/m.300760 type:complete len:276 (-) Transcript_96570:69-896(-)